MKEGVNLKYGARHLKRAIERHLVYPLSNLIASDQVKLGDLVIVDYDDAMMSLTFSRDNTCSPRRRAAPGRTHCNSRGGNQQVSATPPSPRWFQSGTAGAEEV